MARARQMDRNRLARAMFREHGFDVEAVSWIRAHEEEFMAIRCWPETEVARVVEFLTQPGNNAVHITRIHMGRQLPTANGPDRYHPRVYVAWDHNPEPRMTWEQIEAAVEAESRRRGYR